MMEPFPSLGWIIDLYSVFGCLIQFAVSLIMKSATCSARKIVFFVFNRFACQLELGIEPSLVLLRDRQIVMPVFVQTKAFSTYIYS